MRVSTFSRSSVIAISLFALIFLATMYHVSESLSQSRKQYDEYQQLKSLITVEFSRTVRRYLQSGDASQLTEAEAILDEILVHTEQLALPQLALAISQKSKALKKDIETKYRAMGKLSGDPLALLRNGERGISAINQQLSEYVIQTQALGDEQKQDYLQLNNSLSSALFDLVDSRETMFNQQQTGSESLSFSLQALKDLEEQLSAMPLLEIYTEEADEEDDFFSDEDDKEDASEEALSELSSLISRYQFELKNTLENEQQRQQGLSLLTHQVDDLESIILNGEAEITQAEKQVNQQLSIVVIGLLSFLIIFLATNYWLTRSVVLNPLRKLRDSFVTLVNEGRVDNITGIPLKTELGEISHSFNQMVSKLAQEDTQKAQQLNLVSTAMKTMENQAGNILDSSASTDQHLTGVVQVMGALAQVTDNVNTLSQQVVDNAKNTEQAMNDSQTKVHEVLIASEQTNQAASAGREAILSLSQSVESVGSIVDVISSIADQTNLLALNAAIEAARAGEHGRGFSVVADEVRQLAGKTQESLNQVSQRLEQLNQASLTLENNIYGIENASHQQKGIAALLKENAEHVVEQAIASASVAEDALAHINQQRGHFVEFEQAMESVQNEVVHSRTLAEKIVKDVNAQVSDIHQTLRLVMNTEHDHTI
ncbi:methyl-accepting chemotaxis protein [Thalassotalea sp. 1_MG-2023]|uniref:methyl-accepting chemotaxis protein n=1 Tax=Thalassotalea sp. 1_MG-2023 TaxID=3062680 RepID=UPI0026E1D076|nr:methyl-accepting chemotaxis protein [Thalassotalea sp. 1_MG-2023]MDO6426016.1 methyl-accepting chemotaxis protein [Thalassotalea sp. 1_MG-2023]